MNFATSAGESRQCIHCGKLIRRGLAQCPYCREAQAPITVTAKPERKENSGNFRTGLLLMLLAGVIQYFSAGYSPLELPPQITSPAVAYAVPVLGAGGAVMLFYALFRKMRS